MNGLDPLPLPLPLPIYMSNLTILLLYIKSSHQPLIFFGLRFPDKLKKNVVTYKINKTLTYTKSLQVTTIFLDTFYFAKNLINYQ